MSLLLAPNLGARSEGCFGVPDVLVLPVLELEVMDLSLLLSFLFAVVWAGGLDKVLPLSFNFSWLAEALFAEVSLAALDRHSQ